MDDLTQKRWQYMNTLIHLMVDYPDRYNEKVQELVNLIKDLDGAAAKHLKLYWSDITLKYQRN